MIPADQSDLRLAHGTHPGETGKNNEDSYGLAFFRTQAGEGVTLAVVADGIGGHRAGEVASQLAVQTILEDVGRGTDENYLALLELAVVHAAHVIAERAQAETDHQGMGTTCAVALVAGRRLYTAYVGDSRLYLVHHNTIRQISVDHTWVQEAIELGIITRAEAKDHPNRHVVRRHLGGKLGVKPDFRLRRYDTETPEQAQKNQGLELEPGDAVLLCSDGLSDLVEAEELLDVLNRQALQPAVDELIRLARERGGYDNITVIVLQVPS